MVGVTAADVRDVLNIGESDISDAVILKQIKRAEVTLEGELGLSIDYADCTDAQKEFITVLAAIYAIVYLTGGSAVGLNFTVGDLSNSSVLAKTPSLVVLQGELDRILRGLKEPYFERA